MELENLILNEVTKTQKDRHHMLFFLLETPISKSSEV